jgi:hypothetical protein
MGKTFKRNEEWKRFKGKEFKKKEPQKHKGVIRFRDWNGQTDEERMEWQQEEQQQG